MAALTLTVVRSDGDSGETIRGKKELIFKIFRGKMFNMDGCGRCCSQF